MTTQHDPALTSIIMVVYYPGPALDRTIESVLAQTAPIELIVVNNGNTPEAEARLAARAKNEPRLQLITGHGNAGLGKASNMGARAARGAALLFLRPDCIIPHDAVARMRDCAAHGKPPFMLGARLLDKDGQDLTEARRQVATPLFTFIRMFGLSRHFPKYRLDLHKEPLPKSPVSIPTISSAFLFVAAKDFWHVKGFDERFETSVADMDLCLRFRRAEGSIYFIPGVAVKRLGLGSCPDEAVRKAAIARDESRYYHENFGHSYPQPVLWLLDVLIWARPGFLLALQRLGLMRKQVKQ